MTVCQYVSMTVWQYKKMMEWQDESTTKSHPGGAQPAPGVE
ncbi:MAG: hypothetical protein ACOY3K_02860 [Candidatus Omnitrophota bacterium]